MNLSQPNAISSPEPLSKRDDFVLVDTVFRDYDIRGLAYSELDEEFALRLGRALGQLVLKRDLRAIYIARDGRLSSAGLAEALSNGLRLSGCQVINLGESTTPILNFAIHHRANVTCGVMVTASHNPGPYNGFKIVLEKDVISGHGLQELKAMMSANHFPTQIKAKLTNLAITPQYLEHIISDSRVNYPFKLVIDGGNAVAGQIAVSLFERLDCVVEPLFCEVDGNFPNHHPDPSKLENLQDLIDGVISNNADLGLAFDGDGDRVGLITNTGENIFPDKYMMMLSENILSQQPGPIVFDVKCSNHLDELIAKNNGVPVMAPTGHFHIKRAIKENNALLGGEMSGHIFFNDKWYGFDDGPYSGARIIEALSEYQGNKSISDIMKTYPESFSTPELNIDVTDENKFQIVEKFISENNLQGEEITIDGLRVNYKNGWGLIRASNTSPKLVLRFEGNTIEDMNNIQSEFLSELSRISPDIVINLT